MLQSLRDPNIVASGFCVGPQYIMEFKVLSVAPT